MSGILLQTWERSGSEQLSSKTRIKWQSWALKLRFKWQSWALKSGLSGSCLKFHSQGPGEVDSPWSLHLVFPGLPGKPRTNPKIPWRALVTHKPQKNPRSSHSALIVGMIPCLPEERSCRIPIQEEQIDSNSSLIKNWLHFFAVSCISEPMDLKEQWDCPVAN